ncbi:MAG: flavodoxin family protein [Desulfuromonadaceae bacterium]|nr:flavodoxin family protein [Desulfuromonadaceae bacterium]
MKILAINGSPKGMHGNTGRLLEEVLSGVEEFGAETEIVNLKTVHVQPCIGCDGCHKTGICTIKDDYETIKERLLVCDGFILASPNYIFSVSAQMKALFDRCNGLIHCMALEDKYAAMVETSGGGGDEEVLTYMSRFAGTLGAVTVGGVGSAVAGIRTFPDEEDLYNRAHDLGLGLCQSISDRRVYPEQEGFREEFRLRMSGLVDIMKDYWPFEREYWANKRAS